MGWSLSTSFFGNTFPQYAVFFGLIALAVLAGKVVTWLSKNILHAFASKTETKIDDVAVSILEGPVLFTIFIIAFHFSRSVLSISDATHAVLDQIIIILIILDVAWYLIKLFAGFITHYLQPLATKSETDLDDQLLPIAKRLGNIVILLIAVIMVLDRVGVNVTSLVAGLGIGGLAFALAAQDLLGNLFGGVAILADKPFKLGDRIKIDAVDGTVREIGLRTTRVETAGGTIVILPNRRVVDSILENVSNEKTRRMVLDLGLEYRTSTKQIAQAKRIIREHVKRIKGVEDECTLALAGFADSAIMLKVIYRINKKGLERYWDVQDELLGAIKRDFEKARIGFAYPTRTIYVKR